MIKSVNVKVLYMSLWAAILGKAMIFPGFSMGDILFIVIFLYTGIYISLNPTSYALHKYKIPIFLMILWAFLNFLIAVLLDIVEEPNYFLGSFGKLFVYGGGTILTLMSLSRSPPHDLVDPAKTVLMASTWISLIVWCVQYMNDFGMNIPVWILWFGQGGIAKFGEVIGVFNSGGFDFYRLRGIFMEPSLYGIFTVLILAFFSKYGLEKVLSKIQIFAIYLSLFLTFSLSCYFLFALYYAQHKTLKIKISSNFLLTIIPIVFLFFLFYNVLNDFVYERILGVLAGDDRSASLRFLASIDTMLTALNNNLFIGSSLGYLEHLPESSNMEFSYQTDINEFVTSSGNTQIVPLFYLGSLGLVGFAIFLWMMFPIFKNHNKYFWVLIASCFAHGGGLEAIFWVFLLLGLYGSRETHSREFLFEKNVLR